MQEHLVLASYRPTPRQALARGLYLGGLCALGLAVSGLLVWLFLAGVGVRWLPALAAVTLAGAVLGGDGRLLAHDPGFELKYLTLRQVWESHRNWNSARSH